MEPFSKLSLQVDFITCRLIRSDGTVGKPYADCIERIGFSGDWSGYRIEGEDGLRAALVKAIEDVVSRFRNTDHQTKETP